QTRRAGKQTGMNMGPAEYASVPNSRHLSRIQTNLQEITDREGCSGTFRWLGDDLIAGSHFSAHYGTAHRHPMRGTRIPAHRTVNLAGGDFYADPAVPTSSVKDKIQ